MIDALEMEVFGLSYFPSSSSTFNTTATQSEETPVGLALEEATNEGYCCLTGAQKEQHQRFQVVGVLRTRA